MPEETVDTVDTTETVEGTGETTDTAKTDGTTTKDAVESVASVSTTAIAEVASTPWYKRFWNWLCGKAEKLFEVIMPAVKTAVTTFLNDETNQTLAIAAVKAAIDEGLRGDKAWVTARDALVTQLETSGKSVAATLIDTLLQNAYCAVKYAVTGENSDSTEDTATTAATAESGS